MSESSLTNFVLETSGKPVVLSNAVYQASGSLLVNYSVNGGPSSLTITVEGLNSPATSASNDYGHQPGSPVSLDVYSSTSSTTNRSIALNSVLYDSFRITATWTGGQNVTISGSMTMSGGGPTWNSETLPSVQSYTGH